MNLIVDRTVRLTRWDKPRALCFPCPLNPSCFVSLAKPWFPFPIHFIQWSCSSNQTGRDGHGWRCRRDVEAGPSSVRHEAPASFQSSNYFHSYPLYSHTHGPIHHRQQSSPIWYCLSLALILLFVISVLPICHCILYLVVFKPAQKEFS